MTWKKGVPWATRVRAACEENPELTHLARAGSQEAMEQLMIHVLPLQRRERITKLRDREFAIRDATWRLEEYLETSAIEMLGGLVDD